MLLSQLPFLATILLLVLRDRLVAADMLDSVVRHFEHLSYLSVRGKRPRLNLTRLRRSLSTHEDGFNQLLPFSFRQLLHNNS